MARRPEVEPPAETRAAAKVTFEIFVALVNEGFTDAQALQIVGSMLAAQIQKPEDK